MSYTQKLALAAASVTTFLIAGSALAAPIPASSEWYDLDHDGRIDRAIIVFDNAARETLTVTDASKLQITYNGTALTPTAAHVATSGDPARLVLTWQEDSAKLPIDTTPTKFEINWPDFGIKTSLTKIDKAAPVLVSSTPVAGAVGASRVNDIVLNFSEPINQSNFAWSAIEDTYGWSAAWSTDGKNVNLAHVKYGASLPVTLTTTTANDLSGNAIVPGALYPNPFQYTNASSDFTNSEISPIFLINEPRQLSTMKVGDPSVLAWYTNIPAVAQVKISWSVDGGSSYRTIATVPAKDGSYVWYPPNESGNFVLKMEGLGTNGSIQGIDMRNPLSLTSSLGSNSLGLESNLPPLPTPPATTPTTVPTTPTVETTTPVVVTTPIVPAFTVMPTVTEFDAKAKTAVIAWQTDVPTTSDIIYGKRKDYSLSLSETVATTNHRLVLKGLTPSAMHNVRVTAISTTGNAVATNDVFFQFLKEGDRIKGKGPDIYWWKGGQLRYFPNPKTYLYWFRSWSGITTIGDTQLNWLPKGAPIKIGKTP